MKRSVGSQLDGHIRISLATASRGKTGRRQHPAPSDRPSPVVQYGGPGPSVSTGTVADSFVTMPVIVIGADTPSGEAIVAALVARGGEVRAFVTNPAVGASFKERGVKVAIGDLSDGSHVGAAAFNTFTAVLIEDAASDGRQYDFAGDAAGVLSGWATALREAGITRAIWVGDPPPSLVVESAPEVTVVSRENRSELEVAGEVADLNDRE